MNRKYILLLTLVCGMAMNGPLAAQELLPEVDSTVNPCFTVEELESMIHMPSTGVYDLLDAKGYQMGFYSNKRESEWRDTVRYIELAYSRTIFNDTTDRKSALWLYRSQDGLSNIITLERRPVRGCSLYGPLHQHDYVYDREHSIFRGTATYKGEVEHYDVRYYEDSTVMRLTMRNIGERDTFVSRRIAAKQALIAAGIARANRSAGNNDFASALVTLDSLIDTYPPSNATIETARANVVRQKENYLYVQLINAVNKNNDIAGAIAYCDTLLRADSQNDSLRYIRGLLVDRQQSRIPRYSQFAPVVFDTIVSQLERIINTEIGTYPSYKMQRLNLDFTIHTTGENLSHGTLNLNTDITGRKAKKALAERGSLLQANVRLISKSDLLQPIVRYGINVETNEKLKGEIRWQTVKRRVKDTCNLENIQVKPYVDIIEERYFVSYDTVGVSFNDGGEEPVIKRRVRKPTRRIYNFEVVEKECNGNRFNDVTLTGFKTSSVLSWVPSLVIPGVGTHNQGLHSSWAARAIPFFLCAGISVAGFMMADKYAGTPADEAVHPWENRKVDLGVGIGGAVIAGTIYITELVEGIGNSIRNVNRSKQLRKDLRRDAITIQRENIRLR
ncbi:MAG: hypothetical protein IKR33_02850 [Bacteroidales bacterium]|nr:hypothetical protein [Bacteroidales bacterium]